MKKGRSTERKEQKRKEKKTKTKTTPSVERPCMLLRFKKKHTKRNKKTAELKLIFIDFILRFLKKSKMMQSLVARLQSHTGC